MDVLVTTAKICQYCIFKTFTFICNQINTGWSLIAGGIKIIFFATLRADCLRRPPNAIKVDTDGSPIGAKRSEREANLTTHLHRVPICLTG
jgi:hypothetical protein